MATHVNVPARPTLEPLWTNYQSLGMKPNTVFRAAQAPLLSPSPMSPKSLPSPVYPASFDGFMRKKDRALLDSLNYNISPSSLSSPRSVVSVERQSALMAKFEEATTISPKNGGYSPQEGVLESPQAVRHDSGVARAGRRWEDYGHTKRADAFVIARSIRRNSSPMDEVSQPFSVQNEAPKSKAPNRLTLRAVIRPKAPGRQTFLIQRNLDIHELQEKSSTRISQNQHLSVSPTKSLRTPLPGLPKRSSSSKGKLSTAGLSSPQLARSSSKVLPHSLDYEKLIQDPKTVPIRKSLSLSSVYPWL
jgi:hypothetical protein